MRLTEIHLTWQPLMHKLGEFLFLFLCLCHIHVTQCIFQPGKEYIYSYNATSSSGVLLPSQASSSWGFHGKLVVQADQDSVTMQLQSLKMNVWNGKTQEKRNDLDINKDAMELLKPFQVTYKQGLVDNFSVEASSAWTINIKRSIAGVLQLDLSSLGKQTAFHSMEKNHYGQCNIEYVVNPEGDNEILVRKFLDPRTCLGHPHHTWSNVPKMMCPNSDQNPILKSSERVYKINTEGYNIIFVNATGGVYVQPFQSYGEAQFHFSRQTFELLSVKDTEKKIPVKNMYHKVLQHELPDVDLTQGRGIPEKNTVFKSIGNLLDRLSQRLESPGLDTETDNLHNTTISVLLYYLGMLDVADLRNAYNKISGTSYKEETIRNMFLEALPQIGTREAALFILELIQEKKVSDITAIQLLTQLPFHIRKPDVQLLVSLQIFLNLPDKISTEVQNTAILTYGTLIYKTCLLYCPYEMLDDYVRLYLDKFTETMQYEKKMIWLEGLANIQLGRVVEFLEPIASGNNAESRHFRVLAAWASLPTAPMRPDVIYPVYWPILVNRTEHLEMRVAALTLLIVSSPTPSRLVSLYWYMQSERNQHLYNYFYTTLKSMERTTHPCYVHIGAIAAQFTRVLKQPDSYLTTGNYLFDYQDTYRKFGAMLHGIIIANPLTNIPEVLYIKFNSYASGTNINQISLYIKAEGLLHSLSTNIDSSTRIQDILKEFKLDERQGAPIHLEVIARIQEKTVLCLHLNQTNINKGLRYISSLPENMYHIYQNMEFHVNHQRINVPLTMESIQVTDLGANVRLAVTTTSLFSMRGNFTHALLGRNNHFILRTSIHGTEAIESYNPLLDIWHGAERAHSIHGYLPVNITIGLEERPFISYNTPGENLRIGVTGHVRTSTNIRGADVRSKLRQLCPACQMLYIVTKTPTYHLKTKDVFQVELPELGGKMCIKLFDCENAISREKLVQDVWSSHQANYKIWPLMQFPLVGLHFLDYFTYVPPKGSCGVAAYINTFKQHSQVKLEYVKRLTDHMLALTHRDTQSSRVLHQWNLAILYEITSWISDSIKIKATKIVPNEKVLKFCLEAEREIPWEWDFLSTKASEPARITLNAVWGLSDTAKGRCTGSTITLHLLGEVDEEQLTLDTETKWPYNKCREEAAGKRFVPYTDACYEVSRELSTLRKYKVGVQYANLPDSLTRLAWRLRAFYDLIGGNSSAICLSAIVDGFDVGAVFPKDSNSGELSLNQDKVLIEYNPHFIDFFLTRTRIHKYMDEPVFRTFFGICIVTPDSIRSVHNITYSFRHKPEVLLLGQCYDNNPGYAITAQNVPHGINVTLSDETDTIYILPHESGGTIYNNTIEVPVQRSFTFQSLGSKKVRLDNEAVDVFFPNIHLYMHWTQEQILFFFPNYVLEFSCGICAQSSPNVNNLYTKL